MIKGPFNFILFIYFFFFSVSKEASLGSQENSFLTVEPSFLLGGVTVSQVKFIFAWRWFYFYPLIVLGAGELREVFLRVLEHGKP